MMELSEFEVGICYQLLSGPLDSFIVFDEDDIEAMRNLEAAGLVEVFQPFPDELEELYEFWLTDTGITLFSEPDRKWVQ